MDSRANGNSGRFRLLMAGVQWPPETFLLRLVKGLLEAGVEVTVGCAEKPDLDHPDFRWLPMPAWDGKSRLRFLRFAGLAVRALACGPRDVQLLQRSFRAGPRYGSLVGRWNRVLPLAGRRWDVVYFPWNVAAILHLAAFDLPGPVVVSCRGAQVNIAPHNPDRTAIHDGLRATFRNAAAVHCVSEEIKREAVDRGLDPVKAHVIRPAVDPVRFRPADPLKARSKVFRVTTTGSLIWRKGHEYALQAMRKLADRGVALQFDIVGEGSDRQRLLFTIHDLGLEKMVTLHGSLNEDAVLRLLQNTDAFLLSSLSEGISNAVLEAMACGLPVVSTDCGGMAEAMTNGTEGFLVPVRDPEGMTTALAHLAADRDLARKMGEAGRDRVEREFTIKRQVNQWLELYRALLN